MNGMEINVSAVFKITDRFKNRPLGASGIIFSVNGEHVRPLYKPEGCFVFTNLPSGPARFALDSAMFEPWTQDIDIPAPGGYSVCHVMLNPSPAYPFGGPVTILRGSLCDGAQTLKNHLFYITSDSGSDIKIAQDDAGTQSKALRLFTQKGSGGLRLPGRFLIDGKGGRQEICFITEKNYDQDAYELQEKLLGSHPRGTRLLEACEFRTNGDGAFFAAFPCRENGKAVLSVLVPVKGKIKTKQIEVLTGKENNGGTIDI